MSGIFGSTFRKAPAVVVSKDRKSAWEQIQKLFREINDVKEVESKDESELSSEYQHKIDGISQLEKRLQTEIANLTSSFNSSKDDPNAHPSLDEDSFWAQQASLEASLEMTRQKIDETRLSMWFPKSKGFNYAYASANTYIGIGDFWLSQLRCKLFVDIKPGRGEIWRPDTSGIVLPTALISAKHISLSVMINQLSVRGDKVSSQLRTIREVELHMECEIVIPLVFAPPVSLVRSARKPSVHDLLLYTWQIGSTFKFSITSFNCKTKGMGSVIPDAILRPIVQSILSSRIKQAAKDLLHPHLGVLLALHSDHFCRSSTTIAIVSIPQSVLNLPINESMPLHALATVSKNAPTPSSQVPIVNEVGTPQQPFVHPNVPSSSESSAGAKSSSASILVKAEVELQRVLFLHLSKILNIPVDVLRNQLHGESGELDDELLTPFLTPSANILGLSPVQAATFLAAQEGVVPSGQKLTTPKQIMEFVRSYGSTELFKERQKRLLVKRMDLPTSSPPPPPRMKEFSEAKFSTSKPRALKWEKLCEAWQALYDAYSQELLMKEMEEIGNLPTAAQRKDATTRAFVRATERALPVQDLFFNAFLLTQKPIRILLQVQELRMQVQMESIIGLMRSIIDHRILKKAEELLKSNGGGSGVGNLVTKIIPDSSQSDTSSTPSTPLLTRPPTKPKTLPSTHNAGTILDHSLPILFEKNLHNAKRYHQFAASLHPFLHRLSVSATAWISGGEEGRIASTFRQIQLESHPECAMTFPALDGFLPASTLVMALEGLEEVSSSYASSSTPFQPVPIQLPTFSPSPNPSMQNHPIFNRAFHSNAQTPQSSPPITPSSSSNSIASMVVQSTDPTSNLSPFPARDSIPSVRMNRQPLVPSQMTPNPMEPHPNALPALKSHASAASTTREGMGTYSVMLCWPTVKPQQVSASPTRPSGVRLSSFSSSALTNPSKNISSISTAYYTGTQKDSSGPSSSSSDFLTQAGKDLTIHLPPPDLSNVPACALGPEDVDIVATMKIHRLWMGFQVDEAILLRTLMERERLREQYPNTDRLAPLHALEVSLAPTSALNPNYTRAGPMERKESLFRLAQRNVQNIDLPPPCEYSVQLQTAPWIRPLMEIQAVEIFGHVSTTLLQMRNLLGTFYEAMALSTSGSGNGQNTANGILTPRGGETSQAAARTPQATPSKIFSSLANGAEITARISRYLDSKALRVSSNVAISVVSIPSVPLSALEYCIREDRQSFVELSSNPAAKTKALDPMSASPLPTDQKAGFLLSPESVSLYSIAGLDPDFNPVQLFPVGTSVTDGNIGLTVTDSYSGNVTSPSSMQLEPFSHLLHRMSSRKVFSITIQSNHVIHPTMIPKHAPEKPTGASTVPKLRSPFVRPVPPSPVPDFSLTDPSTVRSATALGSSVPPSPAFPVPSAPTSSLPPILPIPMPLAQNIEPLAAIPLDAPFQKHGESGAMKAALTDSSPPASVYRPVQLIDSATNMGEIQKHTIRSAPQPPVSKAPIRETVKVSTSTSEAFSCASNPTIDNSAINGHTPTIVSIEQNTPLLDAVPSISLTPSMDDSESDDSRQVTSLESFLQLSPTRTKVSEKKSAPFSLGSASSSSNTSSEKAQADDLSGIARNAASARTMGLTGSGKDDIQPKPQVPVSLSSISTPTVPVVKSQPSSSSVAGEAHGNRAHLRDFTAESHPRMDAERNASVEATNPSVVVDTKVSYTRNPSAFNVSRDDTSKAKAQVYVSLPEAPPLHAPAFSIEFYAPLLSLLDDIDLFKQLIFQ